MSRTTETALAERALAASGVPATPAHGRGR